MMFSRSIQCSCLHSCAFFDLLKTAAFKNLCARTD